MWCYAYDFFAWCNGFDCEFGVLPVQPWDALVCTSDAVKKSVKELLSSQIDYLRHRLKATQFPLPQLPVIPLGTDTKKFAPPSPMKSKECEKFLG